MSNPLLTEFTAPFQTPPFDKIKNENFLPAIKAGIEQAKAVMEEVKKVEHPTFENIVLPMEQGSETLDKVAAIFFNLHSAETNDEIQALAKEISPLLTKYSNDVSLDEKLFQQYKTVYENREKENLTPVQLRLLEKNYKSFTRNGALLSAEDKEKLRELDEKLSQLKLKFGDNVLKETNDFIIHIEDENRLKGLPESFLEAAAEEAKSRDLKGWVLTLQAPSYLPVMTYAEDRELRKEMFLAYGSRAFKGNEQDNKENVKQIASLRHERANLLGYKTHADFVLEERMAGGPQTVHDFLQKILTHAKPVAEAELKELQEFAAKEKGPEDFQRWDFAYYSEKLKNEKFNISDEMLKPFFSLEKVVDGVFQVANKLYGLSFVKRTDIPTYHEDVQAYEVIDENDNFISVFYADFFPRTGKRGGAWMTSYRDQAVIEGVDRRPHVSIVCNFTKPTATKPSLLTLNEVLTLFHEFGHALHGMLSKCEYASLSGTNVYWDFVELPSQVLENWVYEKECLDLFASHFETGEKITPEMIERIKASSNFQEGYSTVRQLSFGILDMAWHGNDPRNVTSVDEFEKAAMSETELFPSVEGVNMSCAFSHIFQGGYSAGYYSYKWAEVLDADAFELFKEKGLFNKDVAASFRDNVLSQGGTKHPMELYKQFRGKEPSVDALLRRGGLL